MPSLSLLLRGWQGRGRTVECPFRGLAEYADFRTGQIAVLGGASGGGKSTLCANWAIRSSQPVLYLAQEDPFSTIKTMVAVALDVQRSDVTSDDVDYWSDRLANYRPDLVVETGSHTTQKIEARLIAYREWLMESMPLVIVDSLFDLKVEGASYGEFGFYTEVLPEIKRLSLEYDTSFLLQHHLKRGGDVGLGIAPFTMTDLMFGGEKEAAHVWGVYRRLDSRQMYVTILKNRNGKNDPSGNLKVALDWQPETGRLFSR